MAVKSKVGVSGMRTTYKPAKPKGTRQGNSRRANSKPNHGRKLLRGQG